MEPLVNAADRLIDLGPELRLAQRPPRQDSTKDQLTDLYAIATRLGMYDAADFIRKVALTKRDPEHQEPIAEDASGGIGYW